MGYQKAMRDYLKREHPEVWNWFASTEAQADYTASVELELLKSTYRMDRDHHADLYQMTDKAAERLQLDVPITLYQSQDVGINSAALYYTPGQGHVVLIGKTLTLLTAAEVRAAIGHELAHFLLWTEDDGDFLVADRLLATLSNEPRAQPCHVESARLYQLYTEIYADHGALIVSQNMETVVSTLVKIHTGLESVDPSSYLAQAEEIFAKDNPTTEGQTHPEVFIRARAIRLWSNGPVDVKDNTLASMNARDPDTEKQIMGMIEGPPKVGELDLLGQELLSRLTKDLVNLFLQPTWLRTEKMLAHARLFFPQDNDLSDQGRDMVFQRITALQPYTQETADFFTYVLLDFATVDRDLEQNGLVAALKLADELGIGDRLEKVAMKELNAKKRDLTRLRKDAVQLMQSAAEQIREQTNDSDV